MTPAEPAVELAVDARTDLGEGPVWDDRLGRLYFVDINACRLHAWEPETGERFSIEAPECVGCVALTSDTGKVLLGLHRCALRGARSGRSGHMRMHWRYKSLTPTQWAYEWGGSTDIE
jgi:sugar lactone lactonase YvrE